MTETIKVMISHAKNKIRILDGIKYLESEREYWKGRLDALEDALKAIKIESDWSE